MAQVCYRIARPYNAQGHSQTAMFEPAFTSSRDILKTVYTNFQGDSGGPLQCQRSDGRYVLAGLTSWGTICAAPNQPTVFSRVSTQLLWIWLTAGATP